MANGLLSEVRSDSILGYSKLSAVSAEAVTRSGMLSRVEAATDYAVNFSLTQSADTAAGMETITITPANITGGPTQWSLVQLLGIPILGHTIDQSTGILKITAPAANNGTTLTFKYTGSVLGVSHTVQFEIYVTPHAVWRRGPTKWEPISLSLINEEI